MTMTTQIWEVLEKPEITVEYIPSGLQWVVWGPSECADCNVDCHICGGTGEKILATCAANPDGSPVDPDMLKRVVGLETFTPERIQ